jgi:hypothetical protein
LDAISGRNFWDLRALDYWAYVDRRQLFVNEEPAQVRRERGAQRIGLRAFNDHPSRIFLPAASIRVECGELQPAIERFLAIFPVDLCPAADKPFAVINEIAFAFDNV